MLFEMEIRTSLLFAVFKVGRYEGLQKNAVLYSYLVNFNELE